MMQMLLPLLAAPLVVGLVVASHRRARAGQAATTEAERARIRRDFDTYVMGEVEATRPQITRADQTRRRLESAAAYLGKGKVAVRKPIVGDRPLIWATAGALIFGFVWFVGFRELVALDRDLFLALGLEASTVEARARLVAIFVSVLGIILADLVGLSHLLPGIERLSRIWRGVLACYVLLLLGFAMAQLPELAEQRSAPIRERVIELEANLTVLQAQPDPNPGAVAQLEAQIELESEKLSTARYGDTRLIVAAAGAEVLSSWALPVAFGLLCMAAISLLQWLTSGWGARIQSANDHRTSQMWARMIRAGAAADLTAEEMRPVLRRYASTGSTENQQEDREGSAASPSASHENRPPESPDPGDRPPVAAVRDDPDPPVEEAEDTDPTEGGTDRWEAL